MMKKIPRQKSAPREKQIIGWREMVGLPELGVSALRAKIDTGARTSALHAVDLRLFDKDGAHWIEFHIARPDTPSSVRCSAPVVDERQIKNTSGVPEQRYVVETLLVLGHRRWRMEVSLADREQMGFDLILGRTAIRRRRLLVDPGRSFLAGAPGGRSLDQVDIQKEDSGGQPRPRKTSRRNQLQTGG